MSISSIDQVLVPFVDLKLMHRGLAPQIDAAIQNVMCHADFIMGPELAAFEEAFARYLGTEQVIGVSSGTDALYLSLKACGIGPGDVVITTPNTYIATCEAITQTGAQFAWIDIDPHSYNIDADRLEDYVKSCFAGTRDGRAIGRAEGRLRAILPVHLYGQPADMNAIMEIARRYELRVIEDACQAHGARVLPLQDSGQGNAAAGGSSPLGQMAGTFGDAGCFSFYPAKNLGAYGDGGAVVTNSDEVADKILQLRNHGQREKYVHLIEGHCNRLDNLQAAILSVKLPYLEEWNQARRDHAVLYDRLLRDAPGVVTPHAEDGLGHVYHLYVIQVPNRDRVQSLLREAGIETGIHYPIPLHEQPAYASLCHNPADFPVSHALASRILSLPMFPEMTEGQIGYVADNLRRAVSNAGA